ncbi:FAD-dependent oxidoreductase [Amycolatopsis arida]|uniref:FAD-dependent oxidoreductase n=1 Tax=Amycolatopsis arida TaxID=587909 RepID=UPI001416F5D6|nr:FAD-dependent oxidoreductase [Amycolatopsis arida]
MTDISGTPHSRSRAIVVGAGISGLLAARVLSEQFTEVLVLDRDRFPATPGHRSGAPQSHHAHALMPRGAEILHELFPELRERLASDGAAHVTTIAQARFVTPKGLLPLTQQIEGGALFFSRALLEWHLRDILSHHPRVEFVASTAVVGLLAREDNRSQVCGVQVRRRGGATQTAPDPDTDEAAGPHDNRSLFGDLIVDASGRQSHLHAWLTDLGYGPVDEEILTSELSYASRIYQRPGGVRQDFKSLVVQSRAPDNPRVGSIIEIENDRWHVTLGGGNGQRVPTDEDGFLSWAQALPDPSVHQAICSARPVSPIRGWRTPTSRWRHFEHMSHRPSGLIAIGDAVCSFNPVYAQGMTVAAIQALALRDCLRRESGPVASLELRYHRLAARAISSAWMVTTIEDLRWPAVRMHGAEPPRGLRTIRRYIDLVLSVAVHDSALANRYFQVMSMTSPPTSLFSLWVLSRLTRHAVCRIFEDLHRTLTHIGCRAHTMLDRESASRRKPV